MTAVSATTVPRIAPLIETAARFPAPAFWKFTLAIAVINIVWFGLYGFSLEPKPIIYVAAGIAALALVASFYTVHRPEPAFQAALWGLVFIAVYTNVIALTSYLLTSLAMPLQDEMFAAADAMIGFDWLGWLAFMNDTPWLGRTVSASYWTSMPQVFFVIMFTSITLRHDRLRAFLALFVITSAAMIFTAGVIPAVGAYAHYAPPAAMFANLSADAGIWHLEHMQALRDGTMHHIDTSRVEGLVSFPSFHTALAIVTVYVLRGVPWVFWPFLTLNLVVIVSTLSEGGHFLVDVIAGALITLAAIAAYENWDRMIARVRARRYAALVETTFATPPKTSTGEHA